MTIGIVESGCADGDGRGTRFGIGADLGSGTGLGRDAAVGKGTALVSGATSVGTETAGTETVGTETAGTDTVGTETAGTETVGTETVGTAMPGSGPNDGVAAASGGSAEAVHATDAISAKRTSERMSNLPTSERSKSFANQARVQRKQVVVAVQAARPRLTGRASARLDWC
jgi:hypothetical protein